MVNVAKVLHQFFSYRFSVFQLLFFDIEIAFEWIATRTGQIMIYNISKTSQVFVLCKLYQHTKRHFVLQKFTSIVKHSVLSEM